MARTEYRYRVIILEWPEGSKDEQGRPMQWWRPTATNGVSDEQIDRFVGGQGYFRWPRRVTYATYAAADYTADLFRQYGALAKVIRSQPIRWDEAEDLPETDPKRKERAIRTALKILEDTA